MSKVLLALLRRFLRLGIEGEGEPGATAPADGGDGDQGAVPPAAPDLGAGTGDDLLDDLIDAAEGAPPAPKSGTSDELAEMRARAERAERALQDRSTPPAPAAGGRDAEFDREEAQLAEARRNGLTPEQISWLQWQIDTNRAVRAGRREASDSLQQARDIADRAAFDRLEIIKPNIYKRYAARVESTIADLRAKGQMIPPRNVLLRVFLGDDLLNGSIKSKSKAPAASGGPSTPSVPRGRAPGARSDVNARSGGLTEHEKRRQRLENQPI